MHGLFAVAMLSGIYSLVSATFFVALDAVDVAFTEAAVGAGVSTVLFLATLSITGEKEKKPNHSGLLPMIVVCIVGAALVYGTLDMPHYGQADAPAHTHVSKRYIEESGTAMGIPNIVTSVLASYRGYDTLGEVTVIFTAGVAVLLLIGSVKGPIKESVADGMQHHLVLRVVAKFLIPVIMLFALYVQFHGDFGPGGGFQAGVIFAAAFILYALVFGLNAAQQIIYHRLLVILVASGVLIYGGVGVASMLLDANFLDYSVLGSTPAAGQHIGILLVELGVGITVATVMLVIYFAFACRGRRGKQE
uniref:Putative multisubunit Na+/H+ antiporter, MnhB subunit n=1 Tax=Magnetococcus massalia (strain MO-1) TaxID=451514 RepID=A0A1S7LIE7_MAGMO|nr:Putative multisubunit Na+/H+ antiporter, MnhB subunit [Candidatus Magnetococcus massalia]